MKTQLEPKALRYVSVEELTFALGGCGFGKIAVIGGYSQPPAPLVGARVLTFEAVGC